MNDHHKPVRQARRLDPRSNGTGRWRSAALLAAVLAVGGLLAPKPAEAQELLDARLTVKPVVAGLNQPTALAFLSANDFLVLEKATGRVQRVLNGVLQGPVLDLAVNSAAERGLLGIALDPQSAAGV